MYSLNTPSPVNLAASVAEIAAQIRQGLQVRALREAADCRYSTMTLDEARESLRGMSLEGAEVLQ